MQSCFIQHLLSSHCVITSTPKLADTHTLYLALRFPGGIPKLARYMHDRGLKLGIYGDMGTHTCGGYPGTPLDKIELDAQTFAAWEVDMFKFDGCYSNAVEQEMGKNSTSVFYCRDYGGSY